MSLFTIVSNTEKVQLKRVKKYDGIVIMIYSLSDFIANNDAVAGNQVIFLPFI